MNIFHYRKIILVIPVFIFLFSSFNSVYGQSDVSSCKSEMDEGLQLYYDAINDLQNCDINNAMAKAENIYNIGQYVIDYCEDLPNGNAIGAASQDIVEAADSLSEGYSTSIPDPNDGHLISLGSCNVPVTDEDVNDDIIITHEEQISPDEALRKIEEIERDMERDNEYFTNYMLILTGVSIPAIVGIKLVKIQKAKSKKLFESKSRASNTTQPKGRDSKKDDFCNTDQHSSRDDKTWKGF